MLLILCVFFFLLSLVVILGITLYDQTSAVFIFLLIFQLIGIGLVYLLTKSSKNIRRDLFLLFFIGFTIYMVFAFSAFLSYEEANGFYRGPDQQDFYMIGNSLGHSNSIQEIFRKCFIERIHLAPEGAYFTFGSLAFIANNYFDGNSVLFQIINVSFLALLINLFIYKILLFYVDRKSALKYTLYYLLFAYILARSPWIVRDIHITLLFVIAIYLVHLRFSLKILILLFILQIITIEFRFEHGLAFTFFPIVFLYLKGGGYKYRKIYYTLLTFILIVIFTYTLNYIINTFESIRLTVEYYTNRTTERIEDAEGFGTILYNLPIGLEQLSLVFFSQISPFPPWYGLMQASETFIQIIHGVVKGIAPIFWGYVVYVVITNIKYYYKKLSRLTIWLIIFMIIFLFVNTIEIDVRRIMCVYPIMYIPFTYIHSQKTRNKKIKTIVQYMAIYLGLLFLYSMLKLPSVL